MLGVDLMNKRLKLAIQGTITHFVISFLVTFFLSDEIDWLFVFSISLGGTTYWGFIHPALQARREKKLKQY